MSRLTGLVPVGLLFLSALGGGVALGSAPSSPSTVTPSETAIGSAQPVANVSPQPLPDDQPTPAGSYVLEGDMFYGVAPLDITFTIPADGWISWGPGVVSPASGERDGVGIGFHDIWNLFKDPCYWHSEGFVEPPIGPTVADLAAAFARQPRFTASSPTDVTIDGYAGSLVTATIDSDLDFATCDWREVHSWSALDGNSKYYQGPGQVEQFWIIDVEGTRLVIEGSAFPESSPVNLAALAQLVESIRIEIQP